MNGIPHKKNKFISNATTAPSVLKTKMCTDYFNAI